MLLARLSSLFSAGLLLLLLSPSLPSFPPAEAIRSLRLSPPDPRLSFRPSPRFPDGPACALPPESSSACDPRLVHVALTLDLHYLRGSVAAVHSILQHSSCPGAFFFHFLLDPDYAPLLLPLVRSTFPALRFRLHHFRPSRASRLISSSVREALQQPLNYARNYLPDLLPSCVRRVIYLDSDLVVVDDLAKLWATDLRGRPVGAPEYCHANFTNYFTPRFWTDPDLSRTFLGRRPCYFNTGVMVVDLDAWREKGYTAEIERWMEVQKKGGEDGRIYELGSLPPFLLVFAGEIAPIEHRWNQHGLGGDNVRGSCRDLHPGPVSLLHWSGSGKPWARLDSRRPCPLDALWAPYDLYAPSR